MTQTPTPAAPEGVPPKPLDDPKLQQVFGDAIEGALAFGYQGTNKPPEGHWLWRFWNLGRNQALSERAAPPAESAPDPEERQRELSQAYEMGRQAAHEAHRIADQIGLRESALREALQDLLRSNESRPSCQAGLVARCLCRKCATERARAALTASTPPAAPEQPSEQALRWATELAVSMARKFYPEVPRFKPLPDLVGVISQIDNMSTGLVRAPSAQAQEPAHQAPSGWVPQCGDYILATKWSDGDPGDNWAIGFFTHAEPEGTVSRRFYVADSNGNNMRGNGFRRVSRPIRADVGRWLLSVSKHLEASPPGVVNMHTMLTEVAFDLERDTERPAAPSLAAPGKGEG